MGGDLCNLIQALSLAILFNSLAVESILHGVTIGSGWYGLVLRLLPLSADILWQTRLEVPVVE